MAKREISRQVEVVNMDGKVVDMADGKPAKTAPALPTENQARLKEVKPLDVVVTVKAPGIFVMRVWNGLVLFAGKGKMNKIPIVPGKPVTVRVTQ